MDLGIEGRVALVMGGSSGLGLAIAAALAREGARVAIASRDAGRIAAARERHPAIAAGLAADTTDLEALAALPGRVAAALGPIEILVTNTGGPPAGGPLDNDDAAWRSAFDSLVLAPRTLIGAVLPSMRERGWGRIVNVGSTSTIEPLDGLVLSNSNRMATVGLLKSLATTVAGDGITVNTVATGVFATDRIASLYGSIEKAEADARESIPAGRLGRPEEYGDLVAFLASERAGYLTGAVITLDGGALKSI